MRNAGRQEKDRARRYSFLPSWFPHCPFQLRQGGPSGLGAIPASPTMSKRREDDEDDRPRRRRKKGGSKLGLWIGIAVGVAALAGVVFLLIAILGPSETQKKLIGRWERDSGAVHVFQVVEFNKDGRFGQGTREQGPGVCGTYDVSGKIATIKISERANF